MKIQISYIALNETVQNKHTGKAQSRKTVYYWGHSSRPIFFKPGMGLAYFTCIQVQEE